MTSKLDAGQSATNSNLLLRLSNEVNHIAAVLARISTSVGEKAGTDSAPPISKDTIIRAINERRFRASCFQDSLFSDPAWDLLLQILLAEILSERLHVSRLCRLAGVSGMTGLRSVNSMVDRGLVARRIDTSGGRNVYVELTEASREAFRKYFAGIQSSAGHEASISEVRASWR